MLGRIDYLVLVLSVFTFGQAQNNLYLSNAKIDISDSTATMDVKAELFSAIGGFQFELNYDSNVAKVDTIIASAELNNFTLSFNRMQGGKAKVIAISFSGAKISEGLVDLGQVIFKVDPSLITHSQVRLYDPVVSVDSKSERIYPFPGYILHPDQSFITVDRLDSEWLLNLSSSQELSGLQFTFNYDKKIASIDSIKLNSDLSGDKSLAWNEPESGKVKMVVNSLTNAPISKGLSSVLSIYRTNLIPMNFSRLSSSDERTGANLVVYNDDIYVVGGTKNNSLRKYNAQSDSWSLVESEIYSRQWSTAEVIGNKVYMLGGRDFVNYNIVKNQSYDFSTREVKDLADMPHPVKYHGSVAHGGMLYVVGGSKPGPDYLDNLQRYDPSTDSWIQLSPLPTKRHTDAVVYENKIYAVGGYNHNVGDYRYIDVYNIETDTWESSILMPINVSAHRLAIYEDFIFIVSDYDDHLGKIFAYNISNDTWKNYSSNFTSRRHVASIINGQKLYTYGGNFPTTDSTNTERNYFEVSDIITKVNSSISDFAFSDALGAKSDGSTHSIIGLNSYHIDTNSPPKISEIPDTSFNEDSAISLAVNAVDKEGDQIVFSVESNNDNISVNLLADVLTLTPRENWSGSAVIKLSASDGNTSSFVTFIATVNPINDAPYFTSTPNKNVIVDNTYEYKLSASDVDDNNDSLVYALYLLPGWLSYDSSSHIFSGKPDTTHLGKDSVSVSVSDGKVTTFQSFSINVLPSNYKNQPPIFSTVPITAVSQDQKYNYTVHANDPDNDTLIYQVVVKPSWLSVLNDTTLSGTPENKDVGFHEVSIAVKDGFYVVKQDFKIEVKNVNDAPRFSTNPVTAAQEDSLYNYTFTGIDPDDDSLTFQVPGLPSWLAFDGLNTISGIPSEQDVGEYPVIVVMTDGFTNVNQAFFITVKNTNDAPVFTTSPKTRAIASKKYEYIASAIDPDLGATLATYNAKIETYPSWLNENSIVSAEGGELNITLKGTPTADDEGSKFPVVISVTDRIDTTYQRFSIEVSSENYVNASPVFLSQPSLNAYEDSMYTYNIYSKDDNTSDTLEISVKKHPAWLTFDGDTTLFGKPDQEDIGSDSVIIAVTDGFEIVTQRYELTVLASNDPPIFTSSPTKVVYEDSTYKYSMFASDPDSENSLIIFVPRKLPSFLIFDGKHTVSGKPSNSDVGEHDVVLSVSDGLDSSEQSFKLKVVNTNDPPTIGDIEDIAILEDSSFQMVISADDIDGDTLIFGASANIPQIYFNFSGNKLTLVPAEDWFGSTVVTVFANDGYLSSSTYFNLSIEPTQDAPKPFKWISPKTDSILVDQSNFENFYNLKWEESKDVDGEEVVYSVFAKIGIMNTEHVADTTVNQLDLSYQEIMDNVFREMPIPKAKVFFRVIASDGIDTVSISGEDRVLLIDRRDYLSTNNEGIPDKFALHDNFPNPFNPSTKIQFDLPLSADVKITIFNMVGQEVREFVFSDLSQGYHTVTWDARNQIGDKVSAGVYFYQLHSNEFIQTKKMILLK